MNEVSNNLFVVSLFTCLNIINHIEVLSVFIILSTIGKKLI
jgi:hypothetical protein